MTREGTIYLGGWRIGLTHRAGRLLFAGESISIYVKRCIFIYTGELSTIPHNAAIYIICNKT